MPELISLLQLPPVIRSVYIVPQFYLYLGEIFAPARPLQALAARGRIYFKCLRYGTRDTEAQGLVERLPHASCLHDYASWTERLDVLQDHESWKETKATSEPEYDPDTIQRHVRQLYDALNSQDHEQMRVALKTSVVRTLGRMDLPRLYKHCWFGTKQLIDDYVHAVRGTIEAYVEILQDPDMPTSEVRKGLDALGEYLDLHGQTALCLSGGALLGMKHVGVVKCLWESFYLPRIICGTSAGSIVAGIVGTATDKEMKDILALFPNSRLDCFYRGGTNITMWFIDRLYVLLTTRAFYKSKFLDEVMYNWLGDITFQEAYNKTGRILNIAVSRIREPSTTILNYVTAPDVVVRTAVCASCAVPWAFPPATIYEKHKESKELYIWKGDTEQKYVDGSLDGDIPREMLGKLWNANFSIVSQTNPHVRWFLSPEEEFAGEPITTPYHYGGIWHSTKVLLLNILVGVVATGETHPLLRGLPFWRFGSVLRQTYTGDINIYPSIDLREYLRLMMNPTPQYMKRSTQLGERATWPKMPRIRNCLAIEEALKKGIKDLNERLSLGPRRSGRNTPGLGEQQPSRSQAPQPEFLRRRSVRLSRPVLPRSSSVDGVPHTDESALSRRSSSAPDLQSSLSPSLGGRPPSPRPTLSPQSGVGGTLAMTPIDTSAGSMEEPEE